MWRCCSRGSTTPESDTKWRSTDGVGEAPPLLFPMWVLPISVFLAMSESPKGHQELQEEGKMVQSGAQVLEKATSSVRAAAPLIWNVTQVGSGHVLPIH